MPPEYEQATQPSRAPLFLFVILRRAIFAGRRTYALSCTQPELPLFRDFVSRNAPWHRKRLATFQLDRPHGKKVSLTKPIVLLCVSLYPEPALSEVEGACPERSRRVVKNLRRHCNPVASPFAMLE